MGLRTFSILLILIPFTAYGQTVLVKKEDSRIEGQDMPGYEFAVVAPDSEVRNAITRYLKALGRTKNSGDYITLAAPLIGGKKYSETLYATTRQVGNTTAAWFGMISPGGGGQVTSVEKDLEKLTHDFGVTFHREKIQQHIDESLRALQAVEKQQGRLVNQRKDLNNKLESNQREKVQLEKSLVDNRVELDDLKKNLEYNVKAQDSLSTALEQIRKVVEMHQEKQKKVN